jgi:cytochrome c-type biogenesis protein CcmH/NrfG
MNAKTIFTFAGGVVTGLILGVMIFSGGSSQVSQAPRPQAPQQPQVDKIKLQREIAQLEGLVKNDPGNYQAWKKLGDNYFDVDLPSKSIEAYRKALAIDNKDPNVWTDMGIMYRKVGDFTKAIESFDDAIERDPNHVNSRLNKGVVYIYDLQDLPKGIAAWEGALSVQTAGPQADRIRAELEQVKRRYAAQTSGELPPDHPPLEGQQGASAPAPADPSGYFPKPEQQ